MIARVALCTTLLVSPAFAAPPGGTDPVPEPDESDTDRHRFFMPALEVGALFHADPTIRPGVLFRTSIDLRFSRLNAPFLRAAYDASTARMVRRDDAGDDRLLATLSVHDLLAGVGARAGADQLQGVVSLQGGVQIAEVPMLETQPDASLLVDLETKLAGVAVGTVGAEIYLYDEIAVTVETSARWRSRPLAEDINPWAFAVTLGVTTEVR